MTRTTTHSGYIALITVMILTAITLVLIASISLSTYYGRAGQLDSKLKEHAYFLAYSCLDRAILKLSYDPAYPGNETIDIETDQCLIGAIQASGSNKIITASASIGEASSTLVVTVDENLNIISFVEQ